MIVRHIWPLINAGKPRELGTPERAVMLALSVGVGAMLIGVAFGAYVPLLVILYVFLGAVLSIAFLTTTGSSIRPRGRSYIAWVLVAASLISTAYLLVTRRAHELRIPMIDELSTMDIAVAWVVIVLVLEATRRCIGMTLVILVTTFLIYGLFGDRLEGSFYHRPLMIDEIVDQLVYTTNGLFSSPLEVAAVLVFVFVAFGTFLDRWGGGDFFFDLANSLVGRQVGGPTKVAVLSSGLYGSISGSPTADVVTTGSFTIPLMVRTGQTPVRAAAIEAVASTGGAILPPIMGTAAFLMSDFTGIPYGQIVIAALIPGLLYYFSIFMTVHFDAHKRHVPAPNNTVYPRFSDVIKRDWYYFIPLILIVWGVLHLDRPSFAGALSIASILVIGVYKEKSLKGWVRAIVLALNETMRRATVVGVACAVAGLVVGTLAVTDLTGKISSGLFALASGDKFLTFIIVTVMTIVLGMGMPTPAVYALGSVLAAPALIVLGVNMLPAHMFLIYFASMSAITPPVAVAAFAAAAIAQDNPIKVAFIGCRIGIIAFILPFAFAYHEGLLMQGPWQDIVIVVVAAGGGVIALAAAFEGYIFTRLLIPVRAVMLALGLAMLVPYPIWSLSALGIFIVLVTVIAVRRNLAAVQPS